MAWEPESFTPEQRLAAGLTLVRVKGTIQHLDRAEFGAANAELVGRIYKRVDDVIAMLHHDVYGLDGDGPQPPSVT